jgi:hypothetical protein
MRQLQVPVYAETNYQEDGGREKGVGIWDLGFGVWGLQFGFE